MKKSIRFLLVVIMMIIPFISSCSLFSESQVSARDMSILSKRIYNSVLEKHEGYDLVELSRDDTFSNSFFFSKIEVRSSFYLQGTLDRSLTPFFGEELVGEEVSYVFSLLGFYNLNGRKELFVEEAMIIKCGDYIYSFLSPDGLGIDNISGLVENIRFGSYFFLTENSVTKYYEKDDILYEFRLDRKESEYSLYLDEFNYYDDNVITTEFYIDQNSFKLLEADLTIDLLEQTYVERITETAKITSIDIDNMSINVETEKLPSLHAISVNRVLNRDYTVHMEALRVGDIIEFYYFMRTPNYVPTSIHCDYIIFISH